MLSKDRAVTDTEKNFLDVSKEEDERPETDVIGDDPGEADNDSLSQGSEEDEDYVPQSDINDVGHNPELESDRSKMKWKVGASYRRETKNSD